MVEISCCEFFLLSDGWCEFVLKKKSGFEFWWWKWVIMRICCWKVGDMDVLTWVRKAFGSRLSLYSHTSKTAGSKDDNISLQSLLGYGRIFFLDMQQMAEHIWKDEDSGDNSVSKLQKTHFQLCFPWNTTIWSFDKEYPNFCWNKEKSLIYKKNKQNIHPSPQNTHPPFSSFFFGYYPYSKVLQKFPACYNVTNDSFSLW